MLILMRRKRERVLIGDDIIIEICDMDRGRVSLGIKAPKHMRVDREEVRAKINRERGAA